MKANIQNPNSDKPKPIRHYNLALSPLKWGEDRGDGFNKILIFATKNCIVGL